LNQKTNFEALKMGFEALELSFEAGHGKTHNVADEPPMAIDRRRSVEIGCAVVLFGDLLVTGLQQTAMECRSTTKGNAL
jgi:hypothetical protein